MIGMGGSRMGRKLRVYLDTSVISALFDDRNPDRKKTTEDFFQAAARFELVISETTVKEIMKAQNDEARDRMTKAVSEITVLLSSEEIDSLAEEYLKCGATPRSHPDDAQHIAFAVLNEVDYLLSWNFKHLVRNKTRDIVRMVNT